MGEVPIALGREQRPAGHRVQGARHSTNQSEGARVSDDQSQRRSSRFNQSEPGIAPALTV